LGPQTNTDWPNSAASFLVKYPKGELAEATFVSAGNWAKRLAEAMEVGRSKERKELQARYSQPVDWNSLGARTFARAARRRPSRAPNWLPTLWPLSLLPFGWLAARQEGGRIMLLLWGGEKMSSGILVAAARDS